jgi:ribose transport system permease protein
MLLVMITGGIDLSVSANAAVGSVMLAYALKNWGLSGSVGGMWISIVFAVICSAAIGCSNGILVAKLQVPPFIATLATMMACKGIAYIFSIAQTMVLDRLDAGVAPLVAFAEKSDPLIGLNYSVYLVFIIIIVFWILMKYTAFGRLLLATGSNETAVRFAGVNTTRYKLLAYTLSGLLCGIAGVIITAKSGSATPLTSSVDYDMTTIAGVVIGGASLSGGEGTIGFTVLGVLIVAIITNIMNLLNIAAYPQMVIKALVIIIAVVFKSMGSKKNS